MSTVSTYPNTTYLILDGADAASTSVSLVAGVLSVGNPLQVLCKYNAITKASITNSVAEVAKVVTLTPIAAANSVYTIMIQQYNFSTGNTYTAQYTYTTAAVGDTATTISNAFKNQINADQNIKISTDALGGATVVLTAEPGFPVFTVTILSVGGGLTQATTPGTGVVAVGTPAALALEGITVTTVDSYTTCHIEYAPVTGMNIKDSVNVASVIDIYVNETDDTGFVSDLTTYLDGSSAADATAVI